MIDARLAVAVAAGACFAAATTGASLALTSMPRWATLLTGAVLASCMFGDARCAKRRRTSVAAFVCGAAIAIALPASPPPAPGHVATRAVELASRADLFDALARLDSAPASMIGSTIAVSGTWTPASGDQLPTVSRRVVNCCAADAVDVGFDVRLEHDEHLGPGSWVRVRGTVGERIVDGEVRYVLEHSTVGGLEDDAAKSH